MTAKKDGSEDSLRSTQMKEMKIKIDSLRIENQALRSDLDEFYEEFNVILRFQAFLKNLRNNFWGILKFSLYVSPKRFVKKIIEKNKPSEKAYASPQENFSPYKVKILNPVQDSRPKVLHVIGNFYTGGSSQLVVDLLEHLGHLFEQEIIVRDIPPTPSYVGLKLHHYKKFTYFQEALSVLNEVKPDFIHLHYLGHHKDRYSELDWKWYHKIFKAAQEYGCKVIENINIPTDPYVSDVVSAYVYVSDYVRHEFGHSNDRNITVYPGSDLTFFSKPQVASRQQDSQSPEDCIGMVYRLEGDKLNEQAIDVFIKVIQRQPGTKALIVGGGRYLESYRTKVKQAGVDKSFIFTGYTAYETLPEFFEKMNIFVAPVHTESFGQVTPFAMGMGIPVVGYNVGAIPEIVENLDLLAPPEDSDGLASIIIELLNDRQRQLKIGAENLQRAQNLFSVESMINSYHELYDELSKKLEVNVDD